MSRRTGSAHQGAPSVLTADDAHEVTRVQVHGAFAGELGEATEIEVAVECSADLTATTTPPLEYGVEIRGNAVTGAETCGGAFEGVAVRFRSPTAIRATWELLGRAVTAAERHGVVPAVPSAPAAAGTPARLPRVVCEIDPPDDDADDRDAPVYIAELKGATLTSELTAGTADGGVSIYARSLDALEAAGRALLAAVRRERAKGRADTSTDAGEGEG